MSKYFSMLYVGIMIVRIFSIILNILNVQHLLNYWSHIKILVLTKAASENDALFRICQLAIFVCKGIIAVIIHRIVWLHPLLVLG